MLCLEKFRFVSKEDTNKFLCKKKFRLHLRKMQISFCFEKIKICIKGRCKSVFIFEKLKSTSKKDVNQFLF